MESTFISRRRFLAQAGAFVGALAGGSILRAAIATDARAKAKEFLLSVQSPDGAWHSNRYGAFRDGDVLTPLALWALQGKAEGGEPGVRRGMGWLRALGARQVASAEPWSGLRYPLFTASFAARVLARPGDSQQGAVWTSIVERLRIEPGLGWRQHAAACGAWGDASSPPRLSGEGREVPDMFAPNISATALALQALAACGQGNRERALPFVRRCQNYSETGGEFDDGGFFFAPGDPIRNKAGTAGRDAAGNERWRSYESATCDGILSLAACGVGADDPRMRAAVGWVRRHAGNTNEVCGWAASRLRARDGLRYYGASGLGEVLASLGGELRGEWWSRSRRRLDEFLLGSQRADGSWRNDAEDSFEDEPVVATAFALRALCLLG
jgi:hypothetical protein